MLNLYNTYLVIYKKFIFVFLNFLTNFLIRLNNVKLNYVTVVVIWLLVFFLYSKVAIYSLQIMSLFFVKKTTYFFVQVFYLGFFKIHPILLYATLTFLGISFYKNFIFLKVKSTTSLYICTLSLVLGGYWNIFYFKNGKFWSNDSIEILMLSLTILSTQLIHKNHKNYYYLNYNLLVLIVFILLIRYNFIHTKHNFFNILNREKFFTVLLGTLVYICSLPVSLNNQPKLFNKNKLMRLLVYTYIVFFAILGLKLGVLSKKGIKNIIYIGIQLIVFNFRIFSVTTRSIHLLAMALIVIYSIFFKKYNFYNKLHTTKYLNNVWSLNRKFKNLPIYMFSWVEKNLNLNYYFKKNINSKQLNRKKFIINY